MRPQERRWRTDYKGRVEDTHLDSGFKSLISTSSTESIFFLQVFFTAFVMIDDRNNHASKIHKMATNIKYFKFLC